MIKQKIEEAFNGQMNAEIYAAYLYFAMSADLERKNLPGFANWMRVQAQEEMTHAMKFYSHINERGGTVRCAAISAPPAEWKDVVDIFKAAPGHEEKVTGMINGLVDLAAGEKDHAAGMFLQWFVAEQVEEEASAMEILGKLEIAGSTAGGLYMLDREMAQRTFAPQADNEQA
jgi:ferritin